MTDTKDSKKNLKPTKEKVDAALEETFEDKKEIKEIKETEDTNDKKIYIGPNLLQLTTYTVVENDFPEHIKDVIDKCPSIEKLFVNIAQFPHYEGRAKTKGTLEHRHYIKTSEFAQGKGE